MPPSNNMGAQFTVLPLEEEKEKMGCLVTKEVLKPESNRVLIDWFAFTLTKILDPQEAIKVSGLSFLDFQQSEHGGMGYKKSLRCGNIVIYYDGADNMGVHISMTGQGCRQFEGYSGKSSCWQSLFARLLNIEHITPNSMNIKRLDTAIDNVDGALDLRKLEYNIKRRRVRSLFKGGKKVEKFSFSDEKKEKGKTIYLGSDTSRLKIRFYNKAAQLGIEGHWVRCELQFMAERAHEAVKHIMKRKDVGQIATAALNHYFQVINLDDSNKSRCSVQQWWSSWVGNTEKLKLTTMKAIRLINEVSDHVKRQYSPTFAMLKRYLGVASFHEFVNDLVNTGKEKLTKKHEMIMACSRLCIESDLPF